MGDSNYIDLFQAALILEYGADVTNQMKLISTPLNKAMVEHKKKEDKDYVISEALAQPLKKLSLQWFLYCSQNAPQALSTVYLENGETLYPSGNCPRQEYMDEQKSKLEEKINDIFKKSGNLDTAIIQGRLWPSGKQTHIPAEYLRLSHTNALDFRYLYGPSKEFNSSNFSVSRKNSHCQNCGELYFDVLVDFPSLKHLYVSTKSPQKRAEKYDWSAIYKIYEELVEYNGPLSIDDPGWSNYAQAGRKVRQRLLGENYHQDMAPDPKYISKRLRELYGEGEA